MGTSNLQKFAVNDTGTNLLSDADYSAATQRLIGNQPGIAQSALVNKALRQSSLVAAAVGNLLAAFSAADVTDAMTPQQVSDLLRDVIRSMSRNPGDIFFVAGSSAPGRSLKANGGNLSRAAFPDLFAAIGTTYGAGDGSTTFGKPDLRGLFVRAFDDGRGLDFGRLLGSFQPATVVGAYDDNNTDNNTSFLAYKASVSYGSDPIDASQYPGAVGRYITGTAATDAPFNATLFAATRPMNIALLACIAY